MSSQENTLPAVAATAAGPRPQLLWLAIGMLTLLVAGLASALIWKTRPASSAVTEPAAAMSTAPATQPADARPTAPDDGVPPKTADKTADKAADKPVARSAPATRPQPKTAKADSDLAAPAERAPICADCGVIESVQTVTRKGEGSGLGAVAGGVLGGAIGNQVGGGDGRKAMTVIGAVGGGFAGHEIEKRAKSTTSYVVKLRMDDGSTRSVEQSSAPSVGQRVRVEGKALRPIG